MSTTVRTLHHRANRIELRTALILATTLGLLAAIPHVHMPSWVATPIVYVPQPGAADILLAVAVVAALVTTIGLSARQGGWR